MFMRMGIEAQKVRKYWVDRFESSILERDDLLQQGYIVFLHCQSYWNPKKSKFSTFYSWCLRNAFKNMYKKRSREVGELDNGVLQKYIENELKTTSWMTEEQLLWDDLITEVERRLSGMSLEVFRVIIERPLELVNITRSGNVTWTSLGKYFKVSRNVIKKLDYQIRRAVLLALDVSPKKIRDILGAKKDW